MGKLILYGMDPSAPVRACLLTLKALEIPFEYVKIDFGKKEHLTKEFLAKNPQHTIPTLEDDGQCIWDSHAIMAYLVRKYGKDDSLYPKDFYQRAIVDQRLHYESGVMFERFRKISVPIFFQDETTIAKSKIDAVIAIYDLLENFLKEHPYIAGDQLTIADFSIVAITTIYVAFVEIDGDKYPKLSAWITRLNELPYFDEINNKGAQVYLDLVKAKDLTIV